MKQSLFVISCLLFFHWLLGCAGHVVDPGAPVELLVRVENLKTHAATFYVAHSYAEIQTFRPNDGHPEDWGVSAPELETAPADGQSRWFKPGQGLP